MEGTNGGGDSAEVGQAEASARQRLCKREWAARTHNPHLAYMFYD